MTPRELQSFTTSLPVDQSIKQTKNVFEWKMENNDIEDYNMDT